ncbi:MAG: DNA-processing protein DprA [Spirochaetaceae bacterium]|nr:DNA-processing protein DprA [Spirochaetaceae bacterium]
MMNGTDGLSANTTAILLLTAPLVVGSRRSQAPILTAGEYRKLAPLLASHQSEPAALLEAGADRLLARCGEVVDENRLTALLNRGFQLSQAVERWHARGIWVVSRADGAYPPSLKKRLKNDAPSVLYGCGLQDIMQNRSFAIVGSRDVSEPLVEYTKRAAALIARADFTVISGGARGVDRAAMNGALEAGGSVVGVLPGDLERTAMTREHRNLLLEERLVLVSPFDPSLRFTVAQAMQRNRVIYAIAEAGLVVNADVNRGGTWAGAVEQLKKYHVPVFVRASGDPSAGLAALQQRGARPWPEPEDADAIDGVLAQATPRYELTDPAELIATAQAGGTEMPAAPETVPPSPRTPDFARLLLQDVAWYVGSICAEPCKVEQVASTLGVPKTMAQTWLRKFVRGGVLEYIRGQGYVVSARDNSVLSESHTIGGPGPSVSFPDGTLSDSLLGNARTYVQQICAEPRTLDEVTRELGVSAKTARDWLNCLVDEASLVKEKGKKPVRYARSLFG